MHATVSAFPYHAKFDANPIMHDMHIMIRKIGDDDDALILLLLMISPKMMVRRRKRSEVRIKSDPITPNITNIIKSFVAHPFLLSSEKFSQSINVSQ